MKRVASFVACVAGFLLTTAAGAQTENACSGPAYELARRFVGAWQEFSVNPDGERLEGRLDTTFEAGGCAIMQAFASPDGAFNFRSLGYVDAGSGEWQETYVLSNNRPATYRWQVDGDDVLIVRIAGGDPATRRRLRVSFLDPDTYRVTIETSPAGADDWTAGLVTMTRRLPAAP